MKTYRNEQFGGFLNDVCPAGQMMLPSAMMCPAGHEGQTSHHCGMKWSSIISERSEETSFPMFGAVIAVKSPQAFIACGDIFFGFFDLPRMESSGNVLYNTLYIWIAEGDGRMENRTPDTRSGMSDAAEAPNNAAAGGFTPTNIDCFIARYTAIKHLEAHEADRETGQK